MEVELEDTKILWPGGVLYGGGETYENEGFQHSSFYVERSVLKPYRYGYLATLGIILY